jgi:cation transport ATPase
MCSLRVIWKLTCLIFLIFVKLDLTPEQQEYFNLAWGIAFIVFGLIFVVFGYRIFRVSVFKQLQLFRSSPNEQQITLFVIGAIAGAATAYLLLQTHAQLALFLVLVRDPILCRSPPF